MNKPVVSITLNQTDINSIIKAYMLKEFKIKVHDIEFDTDSHEYVAVHEVEFDTDSHEYVAVHEVEFDTE
jgi:hypothetical protein